MLPCLKTKMYGGRSMQHRLQKYRLEILEYRAMYIRATVWIYVYVYVFVFVARTLGPTTPPPARAHEGASSKQWFDRIVPIRVALALFSRGLVMLAQ